MVGGLSVSGGLGAVGSNLGQLLPKLNIELSKLISEFTNMQTPLGELQKAFQDACRPSKGPVGQFGPISTGFGTMIVRLAYIAILKNAMDKATQTKLFNVETAINDLWVHLESLKRLGEAPSPVSSTSPAAAQELAKLGIMIEKRQQMFQVLMEVVRSYNETARATVNTLAR